MPHRSQPVTSDGPRINAVEPAARVAELIRLRSEDPKAFLSGDFDYLLGRVASDVGSDGMASANFFSVLRRRSELSPYALKHLSQIARRSGNLMLERLYLLELHIESPGSLPAAGSTIRVAQNRLESGDARESIRLLETANPERTDGRKDPAGSRKTLALLGEAYLLSGDEASARRIFERLVDEMPEVPDDQALKAAEALDRMDSEKNGDGHTLALTEGQHFLRASIYTANREFAQAKFHYESIVAKFPDSSRSADAVFQIGRGYSQRSDFGEALKWFERVLEQYPKSAVAKDALANSANAYSRLGRPSESISRYEELIAKYPSDENLDRAYLNIVDVYRDQGEDAEALKWCAKVREVFSGKLPEAVATFTEARIHFAREEWDNALASLERLRVFSRLGGAAVPGGTTTSEVSFLRGFALEQLKRYSEAIDVYLSIPAGREEYFGWRATERLRALSGSDEAKPFVDQKIALRSARPGVDDKEERDRRGAIFRLAPSGELQNKALTDLKSLVHVSGSPGRQVEEPDTSRFDNGTAKRLLNLGLFDEAAPEVASGLRDTDPFRLALYFSLGSYANRGLELAERLSKLIPQNLPLEVLPRDQLKLLYPAPYSHLLVKYTSGRPVDPRFLLAIMRQESRFDPNARSSAGARGLMQFIATTSERIAGQLGRDGSFEQENLYDPETAVLFGSYYMAELFAQFPDQPEAVAASYNGGEENMARWLARSRSNLPDRYVAEIMYSQSKDYVFKVMANYRVYQFLYDEQLRPRNG